MTPNSTRWTFTFVTAAALVLLLGTSPTPGFSEGSAQEGVTEPPETERARNGRLRMRQAGWKG